MRKIKSFSNFLMESKSSYNFPKLNVPKSVIFFLEEIMGSNILSKFFGDRNLKEVRIDQDQESGKNYILINWKDLEFRMPFLEYDPFADRVNFGNSSKQELEFLEKNLRDYGTEIYRPFDFDWYGSEEYRKKNLIDQIISGLIKSSRKEESFLNIFDVDFQSTDEYKMLEKMGAKVSSTPLQTKRGVLVLSVPQMGDIAIYPNGYIRSLGERPQVLTKKPELSTPIYTLEELRVKFSYLISVVFKKYLQSADIPSKDITTILKTLAGKDSSNYSEMAKSLVNKYPQLVTILPEPEEGFDPDLKSGVSILNRFGAF